MDGQVRKITVGLVAAWIVTCLGAPVTRAGSDAESLVRPGPGEPWPNDRPVDIGFVVDGPWEHNSTIRRMFEEEIRTLAAGEFEVRFRDRDFRVADWTVEGAEQEVAVLLSDPEVDLVIALGVLASDRFCCRDVLTKPTIAAVVIDPELQGLPRGGEGSGVPHLNYLAFPNQMQRDIELFRSIVSFEHLTFLTNPGYLGIETLSERAAKEAALLGLATELVSVEAGPGGVERALAAIPEHTDAVYIFPLLHLTDTEFRRLTEGLIEKDLPTFSVFGRQDVTRGVLAALTRDTYFPRLARRVALNVQRILLGEDAGTIPVDFGGRDRPLLNMETAAAIGVSPRWEVLLEAEQLFLDRVVGGEALTLDSAVKAAVEANLDLLARRRAVAAGEQAVAEARSVFRPQLDTSVTGLSIDEDRAEASFGSQPQRSVAAGLGLSQLLVSDPARANVEIQRQLQLGRGFDLDQLRLDIALETAVTYLNVLRAKTLETIQRTNLEVTRSNLELAQVRRDLGVAGPSEVYRWQSQIAADRRDLIEADANRRIAEIALARLLHRDLAELFEIADVTEDDPLLITSERSIEDLTATPERYGLFGGFLIRDGLSRAPELARFDTAIAAQERALTAAKRSFWTPTVGLQAGLDQRLVEDGAGSDAGSLFSPGAGLLLPTQDDTFWSLAVNVSLPLWTGGSRVADRIRAEEELHRLQLERDSAAERIEQRIRTALEAARASGAGIDLSKRSAEAARANFELVEDAYTRGAVTILDLLDAQETALVADQAAANAVYDFLIDLMEVQRASNRLDFFQSVQGRRELLEQLDAWFRQHGVDPRPPWSPDPGARSLGDSDGREVP